MTFEDNYTTADHNLNDMDSAIFFVHCLSHILKKTVGLCGVGT